MKFRDEGVIIGQKKYGENSLLIKVFSKNHGVFSAFVKSSKSSKNKATLQLGNLISFEYRARLEDNLGSLYYIDLSKSYLSRIMFEKFKLDLVNAIFSIINFIFLEKENHQDLFKELQNFLEEITIENNSDDELLKQYVRLELEILRTLGYGLDLSSCADTESIENLAFVSPKSARAVCFNSGLPFAKKLLKLPSFLIDNDAELQQNCLLEGLKLSGFFIEKFLFEDKKEQSQRFFTHRKIIEDNVKKIQF